MASNNSPLEASSTSIIKFKNFTYKWPIDDFENLSAKDLKTNRNGFKYVESDNISPPNDDRVQFKIQLYPNGEEVKKYVSIYLNRESSVDKSNDVYYKISILNENNDKCYVKQTRYTFENCNPSWGWSKYIYRNQLLNSSNELLCNGKLTVLVEFNIAENEIQLCESQNNLPNSPDNVESTKVMKINNFLFKWKIENFSLILKSKVIGTYIDSNLFHSPQNESTKFFLRLYPNGYNTENKDYIFFLLRLKTCDEKEEIVYCTYAILTNDESNNKIWPKTCMDNLTKDTPSVFFDFIDKNRLLTRADDLLPKDTLTIVCEVQIFDEDFLSKEKPKNSQIPQDISILDNLNSTSNIKSSKTYTHLEVGKCNHNWTVGHFKVRCDQQLSENEFLESKQFSPNDDDSIRFNLRMYPCGYGKESHEYVSFYLILATCEQIKATVECRISIVNTKGDKCFTQVWKGVIYRGSKRGFDKFIERDLLLGKSEEFLPDGKITFACELAIIGKSKANYEEISFNENLPKCIVEDYRKLLESGDLSDFVFVVDGKELQAHKAILGARCAYFFTMFSQKKMKEAIENRVVITEFNVEVMQGLLLFLYCGEYDPKEQNIEDLFAAAHKYQIEELKDLCESSLCSKLNDDKAAHLLKFADFYSAQKLKAASLDYINLHASWIMNNNDITKKLGSELVVELYRDLKKNQNF